MPHPSQISIDNFDIELLSTQPTNAEEEDNNFRLSGFLTETTSNAMADIDEEAINLPTSQDTTHDDNDDLSDEPQDYRFLSNASIFPEPEHLQSLPRRGEKDFEPNPTLHQSDILTSSRNAMRDALSVKRLHPSAKTHVIGIYCPDGKLKLPSSAVKQPLDETDETAPASLPSVPDEKSATRVGVGKGTCVCIPNPKGQHFRSTGISDRWNRTWLLPEEALYLLERGSLDIRWPDISDSEGEGEGEGGFQMSLQGAYACFMGKAGLTMERYMVYAGLRRGGYTVLRAESWDESDDGEGRETGGSGREVARNDGSGIVGFLVRLFKSICSDPTCSTALGPVIGLGIHRSYNDIYRTLSLNSNYAFDIATPTPSPPPKTTPPFRLAYNVYKASTTFRKSSPPPPDFRLAVIDTRTQPTLPTLSQLTALLESTPLDPPRGERMDRLLYLRLRHGWRNVILAVVDQGVVSFLRVGDARFGGEKLYEEHSRVQGVRKGGNSGRGRGRGRGGRGRGRGK